MPRIPGSAGDNRSLAQIAEAFLAGMIGYYRKHFTDTDDEARQLAERGYRFLIDRSSMPRLQSSPI